MPIKQMPDKQKLPSPTLPQKIIILIPIESSYLNGAFYCLSSAAGGEEEEEDKRATGVSFYNHYPASYHHHRGNNSMADKFIANLLIFSPYPKRRTWPPCNKLCCFMFLAEFSDK